MSSTISTTIVLVLLVPAAMSFNLVDLLDPARDILETPINILPTPAVEYIQREDLICSCVEGTDPRVYEKCCACHSSPNWAGQEENLYIEYIDVLGRSLVMTQDEVRNDSVYKVELQGGEMGEIPSNLCNWDISEGIHWSFDHKTESPGHVDLFWDKIVKIVFTRNRIRRLVDLNCLSRLDTLELGYNRITYVSNSSFNTLTYLRVLNLEHNWINVMDPSVLTNPALHLTYVHIQNNELNVLDVTNCLSLYPFCVIDYSHNNIDTLTNVHNYALDTSVKYGPGFVNFQFTKFTTFPDFTNLFHLESIQQMGQLLEFGIDLRNVPLVCDGRIEPYLAVARQVPEIFWWIYLDIECAGPEELEGQLIKDVALDDLVTNLECYLGCACQERPSQNYVYVDCSGKRITDMSKAPLPAFQYCENLHLNLSNNNIKIVENVTNLNKVRVLNLSNNDVVGISHDACNSLNNMTLNLKNNTNLKMIPEQLRYLGFCNIHIDSVLDCDCDSIWMSDWSRNSDCGNNHTTPPFKCNVRNHGVMPVDKFVEDMLDCDGYDSFVTELAVLLAVFILVILVTAVITHQLRYELLILFLRLRKSKTNQVLPSFTYDTYFSFDEEDVGIRMWVNKELIPQLEDKGYQNFLSYRDLDIGSIRDNATIDVLAKTRNFVVILSQSYLDQEDICWTGREWKHAWHMYKANSHKNIVLINYDYISSFDVGHPQIKAFLRVGGQVNFTNQRRDIIEHISRKLGPPIPKVTCTKKSFANQKVRFDVTSLFLVDHLRSRIDPDEATDRPVDACDVTEDMFMFDNDRYRCSMKDNSKPVFDFNRCQ